MPHRQVVPKNTPIPDALGFETDIWLLRVQKSTIVKFLGILIKLHRGCNQQSKEMAQQLKVFATRSNELCVIPRTHVVEVNHFHRLSSALPTAPWHTHTHKEI